MTVRGNSSNMTVPTVACELSDMTVTMTCESSDVEDDVKMKSDGLDDDYYNESSNCSLERVKRDSTNDNGSNDLENAPPDGICRSESNLKKCISRYVCSLCAKILSTRGSLRAHIQQLHKEENVDELCALKQKAVETNSIKIATVQNCPRCTKTFKYKQSLTRHIAVFHSNGGVEKTIKTEVHTSKLSFTCLTCSKMFSTRRCLRQHMRRRHSDALVKVVAKRRACDVESTLTHTCSVCTKVYLSRSTLRTHIRIAHEDVDVNAVCIPMKKRCMKCPVCSYDFDGVIHPTMAGVISHINAAHDENLQFEHLTFASKNEFTDWLTNVENETPCNFQRKYSRGGDDSNFVQYFYCSRSGVSSYRARLPYERKRRVKGQGSSRCGRTCPAHVILTRKRDLTFDVKYLAKHFCHSDVYDQLGHIRMTQADRKYIADKLALNLSFDEILRDVRVDLDGSSVQRRHIITRKDVYNVARALKLKRSNDDRNGARTSVENDKVLRKEFDRLTARCKGKLSRRKLWILRNRHAKALSLEVTMWEVETGREWVVSSEENDTDVFAVTRSNDDACLKVDCEMHCAECEACVHDYRCTCSDYVASLNMCKHVHLVCRRMRALSNLESDNAAGGGACESSSFVDEVTQCDIKDERNDLNVFGSIFQPLHVSSLGADIKSEVSQKCLKLTNQVVCLIQPIPATRNIAQIFDTSSSTDFLNSEKNNDRTDCSQMSDRVDQRFSPHYDQSSTPSVTLVPPSRVGNKLVTFPSRPRCPMTSEALPPQDASFPDVFFSEGYLVCPTSLLANNGVSVNTVSDTEAVNTANDVERIEEVSPVEEVCVNEKLSMQYEEMESGVQDDTDNIIEELEEESTVWLQTEIKNS